MQQQKINRTGCLYLCPTPIGNIKDISLRVLDVLKEADYILSEDTRVISSLLKYYKIRKKIISYHRFSERKKLNNILKDLLNGTKIALLSNAGTPVIQDPGELLVKECIKNNIKIIPLPGPFAGVTALSASGLSVNNFTFIGFLPKKQTERIKKIYDLKDLDSTIILYESPHRLINALEDLHNVLGDRQICIGREITKAHEEFLYLRLNEAVNHYKNNKPLGEFTIVIGGSSNKVNTQDKNIINMLNNLKNIGIDKKTATKIISKLLDINKNKVYKLVHKKG